MPSLRHFVSEDLVATDRLLQLHEQAVGQGLVPAGERGELEFVALAEHARAYATKNAPGMFAWLVRNYARTAKRFVNAEDEEAARRRLRELREATQPDAGLAGHFLPKLLSRNDARESESPSSQQASADSRFVAQVLRALAARGVRDEALALRELQRVKPEWTEKRWLVALLPSLKSSRHLLLQDGQLPVPSRPRTTRTRTAQRHLSGRST